MMEIVARLVEFIAIFLLARFLLRNLFGGATRAQTFRPGGPFQSYGQPTPPPSEPTVITGEMKKDPQCGTYVSTELSIKQRVGNEVLHFCSRQCQQEFLEAHSSKRA